MVSDPVCDEVRSDTVTIGTRVEVRNVHLQTWCRGFQVAALVGDGYLVRRIYDGFILPRCFSAEVIRPC
ncbi:MAG: hypothetical protein ABSG81_08800 [Acidimicrobiales bacterium]|jgi:hypothetical protein